MGNGKKFSEFRRLASSDGRIKAAKTTALSDILVRKHDSDFDLSEAICHMVDDMVIEYLALYDEWQNRREH